MKKLKVLSFLVLTYIFLVGTKNFISEAASQSIPKGAVEYEGNLYFYYTTKVSWSEAKSQCEALGGHLATISSVGEQLFLTDLCKNYGTYAWIGLYLDGGSLKWVTDEKVNYKAPIINTNNHYPEQLLHTDGEWGYGNISVANYICEWDAVDEATMLPGKVKSVIVKKSSSSSMTVSWKSVSGSIGYAVYMKKGSKGKYVKIEDIDDNTQLSSYVTGLKKGQTYYFRVRAYKDIFGERSYGELSDERKLKLK